MSVTTLENPITYTLQQTLNDYNIHHGPDYTDVRASPAPSTTPSPPVVVEGWEDQYRRVPPHRPINREIDFASRNVTLNRVESFFLFNMFRGITIVSAVNRAWRATGGQLNPDIFRWQIGGEY